MKDDKDEKKPKKHQRTLELVGEHTIDTSLLTPGGYVLDAGCRDFIFSRGCAARGCRVIAVDADPTVEDPKEANISFNNFALSSVRGQRDFVMTHDPQARHLADANPQAAAPTTRVLALTIEDIMKAGDIEIFDAVKLDIEGAEYDILLNWPGSIAKQISIEFHEHVQPRPKEFYDAIFAHLSQGYEIVQHEKTARHCTHPNYWDTLLVMKEFA